MYLRAKTIYRLKYCAPSELSNSGIDSRCYKHRAPTWLKTDQNLNRR
jgi:hypothetical protein